MPELYLQRDQPPGVPPLQLTGEEQEAAGCAIGRDYPEPIVDHKLQRERAMARYRAVRSGA